MPKKGEKLLFEKNKAALLVMDVQNHFTHPEGRAYLPSSSDALDNIFSLVDHFNKNERPVILTRHCHKKGTDLGMMGKFYDDHIICGEWDSELADGLKKLCHAPAADTLKTSLLQKDTYDAFWGTGLDESLRSGAIEQLVICGCMTHLCCETTARSAFVRGYEVYFVRDATFTKNEHLHNASLRAISDGFGRVVTAGEIMK